MSETDEDERITEWTVIWLKILAIIGITCVVGIVSVVFGGWFRGTILTGLYESIDEADQQGKQNGKRKLLITSAKIQ